MNTHFQEIQARLDRIEILYAEVKEAPLPTVQNLRQILFDAASSTPDKERALLALIDHPHQDATLLLDHRALSFEHRRLSFTLELARRRRLAKELPVEPATSADAA